MRLFERSGVLYADFKIKGKRFKKSLELADTPANREYAQKTLIPKLTTPKKQKHGLQEYLNIVLEDTLEKKPATYKLYEIAIRRALEYFSPTLHIATISTQDVDEYIRELSRAGMKPKSIKTYLAPLSLAFDEAYRLDIINKNPVKKAKKPKAREEEKEIFSKEEMHSLLHNAKGMLKTFLMVGFLSGARAGEIIALKWNDIKGDKMSINQTRNCLGSLNLPKSGKTRTFKMPPPLKAYLQTIEKTSEWVLGKEFTHIGRPSIELKKLQEELGIDPKTPHAMRHTCVSLLLSAGENPMLIKKMVGHVDMKMIETVYGHHIENERDFKVFVSHFEQDTEHAA
ncbi:MAG: tyrosine-type recombinase/integrase [Sulfurimonas sp.]|uniref:site-specific integrase n=1 Tax=Sulfurimonas sp. TaxID=2022749 RepID=UPI002606B03F|nr:site-specific integrase [Sulfurimonas sp.]MDD2651642.1 tyrosine-type recombinase/integrase [Sulfurimonas sp.]MDD3451453.1 tyrosine-type recombinase/integrase [Sulfurimonas sp.]